MLFPIGHLSKDDLPRQLKEILEPPEALNYRGQIAKLLSPGRKSLAVVGSRNYTAYGKQATEALITSLAGHPINIISGLALGIDSLAHQAALKV